MRVKLVLFTFAMTAAGCNSGATGNTVLRPAADDKEKAAAILKEHGVEEEIVAMQDAGDAWIVSVNIVPAPIAAGEMKTLAIPPSYKVDKSGRVVVGGNGKAVPRR